MGNLQWYINRIKTMSLQEIGYRAGQYLQKQNEKRGLFNFSKQTLDYNSIFEVSSTSAFLSIPNESSKDFIDYTHFDFFGYSINVYNKINWHLDISSGKKFPLSFSKDIDIRSDKFGSAKVVWEINRLQFLLPLAVKYSVSKDRKELEHWMQLVESWVHENRYLQGINWYSNIEVNIRLIVWYFCWQVLWQNEELKKDEGFISFTKKIWLPSIHEHCKYSHNNPSKYSSANNHLVAEYSGLFVASCCWKFPESEKWQTYSKKGLEKEIALQYSASGINKEEAAEYIQFITDFFLIPFAVGKHLGVAFSSLYKDYLFNIADYLTNLLDIKKNYRKYGDEDDGKVLAVSTDIHFDNFSSILTSAAIIFNNERFKAAGTGFDFKNWLLCGNEGKEKLEGITNIDLTLSSRFYKVEGHFIFRKKDSLKEEEIYLHFDVAPLGFLSIAAHGHADALSVTLTVDGYPVIVDVGTYTYHTEKIWRNYFISTIAHNTICIDDANQAQQAGPTMWLDHYKTKVTKAEMTDNFEMVSGEHSGYKKMGCSHERTVVFKKEDEVFEIKDKVDTDEKDHSLQQLWHLHPDVSIEIKNEHEYILQNNNGGRKVKMKFDKQFTFQTINGQTYPLLGWFSPSFLVKQPTTVLIGNINTNSKKSFEFNTIIEIVN